MEFLDNICRTIIMIAVVLTSVARLIFLGKALFGAKYTTIS